VVVALGALAGVAAPSAAQQTGPAVEVTGSDLSDFPTVRLTVALAPSVATGDLDPADIEVQENGTPVDAQVTPLADESLGVLLVVDTSGSIAGEGLEQAKVAATALLDVLPDSATVGVIGFGSQAEVISDFTDDRDETRAAIDGLEAQGGTALYDAVVLAAERARASSADRNAILVLSDGADSESSEDLESASAALAEDVESFYIVSLQTEETDAASIEELAAASGGRVVAAQDPDALAATYVDLGQRIVNQYELVFTSTTEEPTGTYEIGVAGTDGTGSVELALPGRGATGGTEEPATPREVGVLTSEAEPGPLQQTWVMWVGALLVAAALTIALVVAIPSGEKGPNTVKRRRLGRRSLASDAVVEDQGSGAERAFEGLREAATRVASRAVERTESTGRIDAALDRAGLVMRAGEYVVAVAAVAIAAGMVLYLLLGVVGLVIGVLVPIFGSGAFLRFKASRRNAKFADQLSDALMIMAGALRSGFGVGQAIDTVAEEMDDPLASEFRRAILETRLGRDLEDALDGIAQRVQNEDFEWVIDAMRINRQVGGDLAQILDQVGDTIRQRNRLKRQVSALTAEGRISALVLGLLPIVMALVLYSSNPDYMDPLFSRTIGWVMLGVAVGLLVAGALWLKKLIDIEY
jgi:tight adherence protein B